MTELPPGINVIDVERYGPDAVLVYGPVDIPSGWEAAVPNGHVTWHGEGGRMGSYYCPVVLRPRHVKVGDTVRSGSSPILKTVLHIDGEYAWCRSVHGSCPSTYHLSSLKVVTND